MVFKKILQNRLFLLSALFSFLFVTAAGRLFYLQIWQGDYYQNKAKRQQEITDVVLPERGNIYMRSQSGAFGGASAVPLALTRAWYNVWISPKDIPEDDRAVTVQKLSDLLGVDKEIISARAGKTGDPYEPVKDKVEKKFILEIQAEKLKGAHWQATQDRYYPLGDFASQVVGFVGQPGLADDKIKTGQYGLESYFDDELKGESGYVSGVKKALGTLVRPLSRVVKAKKGEDIYLTVDYNIQLTLEKELKKAAEKFGADSASAIVMDPKTGAIMAMASWPGFDPNKYNEVKNAATFLNQNVQLVFEPGSIFKPIVMATALDINVASPDLTYNDTGEVKVGEHTIRNSTRQSWGEQTMTQVLEKSLNTGVIFALRRIPQGVWREYVANFGFAEKTGITLAGEARGDLGNLKSKVEIDWLTSAFGQGISVTPLAMATAISAIANGGELVKPYIVSKIVGGEEEKVVSTGEKMVRHRVIKPETSEILTKMLINAVENGSGKQARIPGYSVAGKTGTAQVAGPTGGYTDRTIHTFVGYSPAFNPAFLALIKLDNPRGVEFSEGSAVPVFKSVGEFILHYLQVQPDKPITK